MLQRHRQLQAKISKVIDGMLFAFGFWLTHFIRTRPSLDPEHIIHDFSHYVWLLPILFIVTPPLLEVHGFYQRPVLGSRGQTAWSLLKASTWITLVTITILYMTKLEGARGIVVPFGFVAFVLVFLKEELARNWSLSEMGSQQLRKRVVLVGSPEETTRLATDLRQSAAGEVEVVGSLDLNQASVAELTELIHEHSINAVIIHPRQTVFGEIEKAIRTCEIEGVEVWLRADFFQTQISQTKVDELYGHPMLVFRTGPDATWQAVAKSVLDMVGSLCLVIATSWVMLLVALAVKLTSPGPILFRQRRAGLNGAPFTMLKFRTMVTNADQMKQELAAFNEMSGPVFKMANDPRITPVGRFLRRWSLDELPQFINVLRGEMSLVGPRPLPIEEVKRFDDLSHRRRLSVKPGLTCLWQVSGRNDVTDFREWVRLDLEYIDNWSFWLDLKILLRTIPAVFTAAGAR